MILTGYMACMDGDDPAQALEFMEPDLRFLIALPGREVTGRSRADFAAYIGGRQAVARVHHILRSAVDGDLEMVYGVVTDGGRRTGAFQSLALISANGRMARYQSFFTTSFELVDRPAGDPGDAPGR
jgi:hypothetical protein